MERGLMFSLEVLLSIVLLALIIGFILTGFDSQEIESHYKVLENQSERARTFYLDLPHPPAVIDGNMIICNKISYFNSPSIETKTICEGFDE